MTVLTAIVLAFIGCGAIIIYCLNQLMTAVTPIYANNWLTDYRYAHRGRHDAQNPENSIGAFERALEKGYAIELDVRLSADDELIVFHDADLVRMTGTFGQVKKLTAEQLSKVRLRGTQWTIPTLAEVLKLVDGKVPLLIEMKSGVRPGKLESKVYQILRGYHGKYAVQSFSPFSMRWFRIHAPYILRGQLACNFRGCGENWSKLKAFLISKVLFVVQRLLVNFICKPNFISYGMQHVNWRLLKRMRKTGATILGWTVRNQEQQDKAKDYVDTYIFEDFEPRHYEAGEQEAA